jgi:hypothetical protein
MRHAEDGVHATCNVLLFAAARSMQWLGGASE